MTPESQKKTAAVWSVIGCIGLVMIALPILKVLPMASGGGAAMLWIGIMLAAVSIMIVLIYHARMRLIASITAPANILVKWDQADDGVESTIISETAYPSRSCSMAT